MKKLTGNLAAKIAAVILSYVCVLTLVITALATAIMGYYKFYFSNETTVKKEILSDMAAREAQYISNLIDRGTDLDSYYADKNVLYQVMDAETGDKVYGNYSGSPHIAYGTAVYYTYDSKFVESGMYGEDYWETVEIPLYTIEVYIAEGMDKNDLFSVVSKLIEWGFKLQYVMIFIMIAALIGEIALLCFLYSAAGHRPNGKIRLNLLDRIPFDIYTAFIVAAVIINLFMLDGWVDISIISIIVIWLIGTLDYFLALGYTMTFATRIKTRTIIKNNLIYIILSFIGRKFKRLFNWIKFVFSNSSLLQKTWLVVLAVVMAGFIFTVAIVNNLYDWHEFFLLIMILAIALIVLIILYFAVIMQKIKSGGERIAKGDLQYKIETKYMFGDFKEFCESLNNINLGLQAAVNERMKSERFKTELITNVSHDIKTPLTSIINYVDLIKKEEPENETVRQYIEVLDRQSGRLKKLVEDLVEASKASTGNLAVNLAPCDVGVLLAQTLGEFEDKLQNAGVTPVLRLPEKAVKIMADGRHLWRVFDNLMNNVSKYALPGTRVYIDLTEADGRAVINFRNISKYELNVSEEELLERFVRGDSSRNTEGSGLGLSIARSLAELQGGELLLNVDGDLFKVTVIFDVITN